ncbi:hypothetical protein MASR2M79_14550 [Aminivibrio sp.]
MKPLYREGFRGVEEMSGPLVFLRGITRPSYGELVTVETPEGARTGQILQIQGYLHRPGLRGDHGALSGPHHRLA